MTAEAIRKEIVRLTSDLISSGLCIDQNFPAVKDEADAVKSVEFSGMADLSFTLKNVPYRDTYDRLAQARSFNIRLIDGGIIQMLYKFQGDEIIRHRLAFFPSPDLLQYQNNNEIYDDDEVYGDVVARNIVTVPVRFDFDPVSFVEVDHPRSHLTLGQYKNCRIAVSGPLSPCNFMRFILRAFYNTPFRNFCGEMRQEAFIFESSITERECIDVHFRLGVSPN